MKRYALVVLMLMLVFTALFILIEEVFQIPLLLDPSDTLNSASIGVALVGVGLLIADVFIPVPSSIIMIAHGALFGIVTGTILSVIGSLGSAMVGFGVGRQSNSLLQRFISPAESQRANALLERYGAVAIIITRPIPIVAETVAIMAGASSMSWRWMLVTSLAGIIPSALLYAVTGATAMRLDNFLLTIISVLGIAVVFWLVERLFLSRLESLKAQKG
jgi:uncharacterized membrane protein YdjX (TVP38/TMEM64 family)